MPGTVTIGCKLPAGLHLSVFTMEPTQVPVMGGGFREVLEARFADRVTIKGTGRRMADDPRVIGGYALTQNVDADVWEEWLRHNKNADVVKNGLIFAHTKLAEAQAQARDHRTARSGFEPIDPDALPDEFKRKIKTADEQNQRN